jgi:cytochrome c5
VRRRWLRSQRRQRFALALFSAACGRASAAQRSGAAQRSSARDRAAAAAAQRRSSWPAS